MGTRSVLASIEISNILLLKVPGSTNYSMVFSFVAKELAAGSLLQRFVDGDDEFRNSRMKLIPPVPKGSWIVRQSVGSTPCLLGKAVDCNYIRGANYLEVDVDIGSSTVANGVLGLVVDVTTSLVVDMAFLVQVKRCAEMSRKLRFFKDQIHKAGLLFSALPTLQPDVDLEALESQLAEHEHELIEMNANSEKLRHTYNELLEFKMVLQKAGSFLISGKSYETAEGRELDEDVYPSDYPESAYLL